jgi:hypothetical protein
MRESSYCHCSLCRIETELRTGFLERDREEICRQILCSAPELATFSDLDSLLAHLRLGRDVISSDARLRALIRAKRIFADGTVERMLILVFLPQMHGAVRSVLRRYPQLSPDELRKIYCTHCCVFSIPASSKAAKIISASPSRGT